MGCKSINNDTIYKVLFFTRGGLFFLAVLFSFFLLFESLNKPFDYFISSIVVSAYSLIPFAFSHLLIKNCPFEENETQNMFFIYACIFFILNHIFGFFLLYKTLWDLFEYTLDGLKYTLVGFIPFLICALIYFFLKKTNYKKSPNGFFILIPPFFLFIWFFYAILSFFTISFDSPYINSHLIKRYSFLSSKMTDETYRIKHFPNEIPKEAKDYYFHLEKSFRGYDIQYLKFRINESYIDKIIDENKDKIAHKLNRNNIDNYYKYVPYRNMNDDIHCTIYILKNENNDDNYTSGIITSKTGEILFFYSNFNLGKI